MKHSLKQNEIRERILTSLAHGEIFIFCSKQS